MLKQQVHSFIDSGATPDFDKKNNFLMFKGPTRKFVRLSKDNGQLTAGGQHWQELTGQTLPESGFMSQETVRDGECGVHQDE